MRMVTDTHEMGNQPGSARYRRGWQILITRGLLALLALLLALPVLGFSYETVAGALETRRFPAPGKLVAVDGRQMHIRCIGDGSPTVVMDAGLGGRWSGSRAT